MCITMTISVSSGVCASTLRTNSSCPSSSRPSYLPPPGLVRVGPEIVDVVEHEEQRLRVEERVVVRPEDALVGLAAVLPVGRLEIEIVVAADVPPRQPDRADDRVVTRVEREIVEHDVAGGEAELGVDAGQRLDQVLANEVDFGVRSPAADRSTSRRRTRWARPGGEAGNRPRRAKARSARGPRRSG